MLYSALVALMLLAPTFGMAARTPASNTSANGKTATTSATGDPKVRVKLSDDDLVSGEKAKVKVKTTYDGYLVVLRLDTEGRTKVLYPVDPTDTNTIRRGKEIEIRSRGDREAFTAAERAGNGMVLAARSDRPFDFSAFTNGERWNGSALAPDTARKDAEEILLAVVDRMSGGHYDYDAASYRVSTMADRRNYAGSRWYRSAYGGWYDPWTLGLGYYSNAWPYYSFGPSWGFRNRVHIVHGYPRRRGHR